MRGQLDLLGEIHEDEEDEIVKIAWEGVKERGYAIYEDYNEHMVELICKQGQLKPSRAGRFLQHIRETLLAAGWTSSGGHPETRYYRPGTEPPSLLSRLR